MSTNTQPKLPADRLVFRKPIAEIISNLSKPVPERLLRHQIKEGKVINYVPWYNAARLLDFYAPGWAGEIRGIQQIGDQVVVVYAITIHTQEGCITREATGQEDIDKPDAIYWAEQRAFRNACAKFGLGLDLYEEW